MLFWGRVILIVRSLILLLPQDNKTIKKEVLTGLNAKNNPVYEIFSRLHTVSTLSHQQRCNQFIIKNFYENDKCKIAPWMLGFVADQSGLHRFVVDHVLCYSNQWYVWQYALTGSRPDWPTL